MNYTNHYKDLLCFFAMLSTSFYSQGADVLVLEVNNPESRLTFSLIETPTYWVEGSVLKVKSASAEAEIPVSNITRAFYQKGADVFVEDRAISPVTCFPNPTTEGVFVTMKSSGKVSLSDLKGIPLNVDIAETENGFYLDLSGLKSGVYLLNVEKRTFKIEKR